MDKHLLRYMSSIQVKSLKKPARDWGYPIMALAFTGFFLLLIKYYGEWAAELIIQNGWVQKWL